MSLRDKLENWIIDDMTPKQVNYVQPVLANQANGKVAEIYQQVRNDFQLVPPITLFSPDEDLLAGVWAVSRESQIVADRVSRSDKEAIAAAVSTINTCPYCVDAHAGMLYATAAQDVVNAIFNKNLDAIQNNHTRKLIKWALATRSPQNNILLNPPFSAKEAPEIIGTALVFHFVNRMVSVFLADSPLPVPTKYQGLRKMATRMFGATAAKSIATKTPSPGESLAFIPTTPLPDDFSWANASPAVAKSWAGFIQIIEQSGKTLLPKIIRQRVQEHLSLWQGEPMSLGRQWIENATSDLSDRNKATAQLLLLTAFAPYQVDDQTVQDFRQYYPRDNELLTATSWASLSAVKQINQWLTQNNQKEI